MRMRLRRRSSSCSAKCSFTIDPSTTNCAKNSKFYSSPQGLRRDHLEVLLVDGLFAAGRNRAEGGPAVEDSLEEVPLGTSGLELRLAVPSGDRLELHAAAPEATGHARDELSMASIEPVGDPHESRQLFHDRFRVRVEPFPVLVRLLRPFPFVVAGDRRDDLDLLRRKTGQISMGDQVVGVTLMLGIPDVAADVVE